MKLLLGLTYLLVFSVSSLARSTEYDIQTIQLIKTININHLLCSVHLGDNEDLDLSNSNRTLSHSNADDIEKRIFTEATELNLDSSLDPSILLTHTNAFAKGCDLKILDPFVKQVRQNKNTVNAQITVVKSTEKYSHPNFEFCIKSYKEKLLINLGTVILETPEKMTSIRVNENCHGGRR